MGDVEIRNPPIDQGDVLQLRRDAQVIPLVQKRNVRLELLHPGGQLLEFKR